MRRKDGDQEERDMGEKNGKEIGNAISETIALKETFNGDRSWWVYAEPPGKAGDAAALLLSVLPGKPEEQKQKSE